MCDKIFRPAVAGFLALSFFLPAAIRANALQGEWNGPFCWPSPGTHMIHLHTGKILIWPGHYSDSDRIEAWLWEPKAGCYGDNPRNNPDPNCFTRVDNDETNLFCSGHASLADGSFLVTGGHTGGTGSNVGLPDANIFDPKTETWTGRDDGVARMSDRRWYPTSTTLPDGRILTVSGSNRRCNLGPNDGENCTFHGDCGNHGSCGNDNLCSGGDNHGQACTENSDCLGVGTCDDIHINAIPEIFNPVPRTWDALNQAPLGMPFYPLMFVLPDGDVFYAGSEDNYPATNPDVTALQNFSLNVATQTWSFVDSSSIPGASGVMYEPGKVLKVGGGFNPATNGAQVIDLTPTGSRQWRTVASMSAGRVRSNLTLLPDGTALVTGGTRRGNREYNRFCEGGSRHGEECSTPDIPPGNPGAACPASNDPSPPNDGCPGGTCTGGDGAQQWVAQAELFDPGSETWNTMASMQTPRMYHSTAILIPDGRVIKAGGGQGGGGIHDYSTFEIFSPPYLFKGPRPNVGSVPQAIGYGHDFLVATPDAADVQTASLIRLAAATHGFNQNQRYVQLVYRCSKMRCGSRERGSVAT